MLIMGHNRTSIFIPVAYLTFLKLCRADNTPTRRGKFEGSRVSLTGTKYMSSELCDMRREAVHRVRTHGTDCRRI
jgi:hypothetical protein